MYTTALLAALDKRLESLREADDRNGTNVAIQTVRQIAGYLRVLSQTTYTKVEVPDYVSKAFMRYSAMKLRPSEGGSPAGSPSTDEDFITLLQMQVTDVELFHAILSSFDDVQQLRLLQSSLTTTNETFIQTLKNAEQYRLYSVFYFYGLAEGKERERERKDRPRAGEALLIQHACPASQ